MFQQFSGEIEKSKYIIRIPTNIELSGNVLIFCHGYRPKGVKLKAIIEDRKVYKKLYKKGWIISALSYRREGYILEDAIKDVNSLRFFIEKKYFFKNEKKCNFYLEGQSMGGAIVTLIAERFGEFYSCAFGIGAALWIDPIKEKRNNNKKKCIQFNYEPKIPILYLMNASETACINGYVKNIKKDEYKKNVALWYVERCGHCNVTDIEVENAFFSLMEWKNGRKIDYKFDTTDYSIPKSVIRYVNTDIKKGGYGKVIEIDEIGNVYLNFNEGDFKKLFIFQKNAFILQNNHGQSFNIIYCQFPFVGIPEEKLIGTFYQHCLVIKNRSVKTIIQNGSKILNVELGDEVFIEEKKIGCKKRSGNVTSNIFKKNLKIFE